MFEACVRALSSFENQQSRRGSRRPMWRARVENKFIPFLQTFAHAICEQDQTDFVGFWNELWNVIPHVRCVMGRCKTKRLFEKYNFVTESLRIVSMVQWWNIKQLITLGAWDKKEFYLNHDWMVRITIANGVRTAFVCANGETEKKVQHLQYLFCQSGAATNSHVSMETYSAARRKPRFYASHSDNPARIDCDVEKEVYWAVLFVYKFKPRHLVDLILTTETVVQDEITEHGLWSAKRVNKHESFTFPTPQSLRKPDPFLPTPSNATGAQRWWR